jgi:hypothetical protein
MPEQHNSSLIIWNQTKQKHIVEEIDDVSKATYLPKDGVEDYVYNTVNNSPIGSTLVCS